MSVAIPPSPAELQSHPVVSRDEWMKARRELLAREKEMTRLAEQLAAERRKLPWVDVKKEYFFETPKGRKTLADLFDGRSQLAIYHFMFGPGWGAGCDGCSLLADHFDGANLHLPHNDVSLVVVSRAPLKEFLPFKERMGWKFPWVSSHGSDFNYDFEVASTPEARAAGRANYNYHKLGPDEGCDDLFGMSVFHRREDGRIFHTYSTFARGLDWLCTAHQILDFVPKGRNETSTMDWVRLHDEYEG